LRLECVIHVKSRINLSAFFDTTPLYVVVSLCVNTHFRTGWISDVHLGTKGSNAGSLLEFLKEYEFETLYIVGDLIDGWKLRRGIYWPQSHSDVIQKILRKGRKGTKIIYIPGNHDEFLADFLGIYGSIVMKKNDIHMTADGRRLLVMHGHELDAVVQNMRWLAFVGDVGYEFLLKTNRPLNWFRKRFGMGYWSLSSYAKQRIKNAVSFVGKFEESVVRYAMDYNVAGVVCGHIHWPVIRKIGALVEDFDGKIHLLKNLFPEHHQQTAEGEPGEESEVSADVGELTAG
jgi:UDP-2,3-diacylglucosamine pyrophosphatase LpxH